ncbi:leucine-rich repeat-containing protein 58-like [Oppia nitens]|uniref:leucine-rich repeat-containing protein 58-like n=1 Tax=Oppia nitens TaxID=1686743 RepID=UPI0023DA458F|nr:leucine-rich repeat-containing protein 58-like [Oppia nitens]
MAEASEPPESDISSGDDWDYRSRSSSDTSTNNIHHRNLLFTTGRQLSCDQDTGSLDLSYLNLDTSSLGANISQFADNTNNMGSQLSTVNMSGNRLMEIPYQLSMFTNLQMLDLSHNQLAVLCDSICQLNQLRTLICANNQLDDNSLPKDFGQTFGQTLRVLSLGGNLFKTIPPQILELRALKSLYLGSNAIETVPRDICRLDSLRLLYLGGNRLEELPEEVGRLQHLESLSLCENRLKSLPSTIAQLKSLRSLALHRNQLTTLPPDIVKLRYLMELSLRNNPLVMRFIRDMMFEVPSLMELSGRAIKLNKLNYNLDELPNCLVSYLSSAHRCVNPKCKGVYFDSRVEHIKFVDFCGSYRVPLLQYLCSPQCSSIHQSSPLMNRLYSSDENNSDEESVANNPAADEMITEFRLKRVLLG